MFKKERIPRTLDELAKKIDHTVLKPQEPLDRVYKAIEETEKHGFRALVIPPWTLKEVKGTTKTKLATVISFPLGHDPIEIKKKQIEKAIDDGASEVDVVINISALITGKKKILEEEAEALTKTAHELGAGIKFIIETGLLDTTQIECIAKTLQSNNVDYVKTCTGFGPRGVTIDDIILLRNILGENQGIKASGGIRTGLQALLLIGYGANVLGTSSSIKIIKEYRKALEIMKL